MTRELKKFRTNIVKYYAIKKHYEATFQIQPEQIKYVITKQKHWSRHYRRHRAVTDDRNRHIPVTFSTGARLHRLPVKRTDSDVDLGHWISPRCHLSGFDTDSPVPLTRHVPIPTAGSGQPGCHHSPVPPVQSPPAAPCSAESDPPPPSAEYLPSAGREPCAGNLNPTPHRTSSHRIT